VALLWFIGSLCGWNFGSNVRIGCLYSTAITLAERDRLLQAILEVSLRGFVAGLPEIHFLEDYAGGGVRLGGASPIARSDAEVIS